MECNLSVINVQHESIDQIFQDPSFNPNWTTLLILMFRWLPAMKNCNLFALSLKDDNEEDITKLKAKSFFKMILLSVYASESP